MVIMSAIITAHGDSVRANGDRGVPPLPGWRRNASFFPSGDHAGRESREVDGAMNRMGRSGVNSPMKL